MGNVSQPTHDPEDRFAVFAAAFVRALREMEDRDDAIDADAAWEEPGKSIPLADLEAEFGQG